MKINKTQEVIKVKAFGDDEEEDESLPVKKDGFFKPKKKGQSFFSIRPKGFFKPKPKGQAFFKKPPPEKPHQQTWFKKKHVHHRQMDLEDLYDTEDYALYRYTQGGYYPTVMPGYRLKSNWKQQKKAWQNPTPRKFRKCAMEDSNWVEVFLPNGMVIEVQPRSATPKYYASNGN